MLIEFESEYYSYIPSFSKDRFDKLYPELVNKCSTYSFKLFNKQVTPKRISCVFLSKNTSEGRDNIEDYTYSSIPYFDWEESSEIMKIKKRIENFIGKKFDYCLAHIYNNGEANIGWHNDREALNTSVVSISFGATRKFRLRKIERKNGWDDQIYLKSGDLLHMFPGCQKVYKHTVPIEKTVKKPRINLTFRQY